MRDLFIVTSAIKIEGQSSVKRYFQTLHTIDSIKSRLPNADIWLCDSSHFKLDKWMEDLLPSNVKIISFSKDSRVHQILKEYKYLNLPVSEKIIETYRKNWIKNATEAYVIKKVLEMVNPKQYDRIFKISGRYFLNNMFISEQYASKNKITLKEKTNSSIGSQFIDTDFLRICVLYCVPTNLLEEFKIIISNIENFIIEQPKKRKLGDIEHGLDVFIDDFLISDIKELGVTGIVNNGTETYYSF